MDGVTVRDLRNHGGEVLTRVAGGESVIITRDGAPVAELRPLPRRSVPVIELIARRATLRQVDYAAMKADIDALIDTSL